MAVEASTTISGLNSAWPLGTDIKAEGDNHLRLIKSVLKGAFDDSGTSLKTTLPLSTGSIAQCGQIYGLVLSNNASDAVNSIDVAPGSAASDDAIPWMINLTGVMTKKTNAAWAAGGGNGGFLDSGSMPANSQAHCYLIGKSTDLTAADIAFSASLTPTLPTGWDRKRRIMTVLRDPTQIRPFRQLGNRVLLNPPVNVRGGTAAVTDVLVTVSGPQGIRHRPILHSSLIVNASSNASNVIADGDVTTTAPFNSFQLVAAGTGGTASDATIIDHVYTNTSSQIRLSTLISSGTINGNNLNSVGWWDDRGIYG